MGKVNYMRCAYDKVYLNSARRVVGRAFDIIVNSYHFTLEEAADIIAHSDELALIEQGKFNAISGKTASNIAFYAISKKYSQVEPLIIVTGRETKEYWIGSTLAAFQWKKNIPFIGILQTVSIDEIASLYDKYSRSDYKAINDRLDEIFKQNEAVKRLQKDTEPVINEALIIPRIPAINGNKVFRWNGRSYLAQKLEERDKEAGKKYYLTIKDDGHYKPIVDVTNYNLLKFKSIPEAQRYIRSWDFMTTTMY